MDATAIQPARNDNVRETAARETAARETAMREVTARPTPAQRVWLTRGLDQPGGKLPLFDRDGKRVSTQMVRACIEAGWAAPWFANPMKPDWLVCKLTAAGRAALAR